MLTRVAIFAALVILAIIFQTFFAGLIAIGKVMPDIYIILVVFLTLTHGLAYGAAFGFASGLIESSADPYLLGLSALLKVLLAMMIFLLSARFRLETQLARILVVVLAVAVHNVLYYTAAYGANIQLTLYSSFKYALLDALYSALITVIFVYLSERKLTLKFEA